MLKWNDTDYLYISIYTVFILDDDCKLDAILLQATDRSSVQFSASNCQYTCRSHLSVSMCMADPFQNLNMISLFEEPLSIKTSRWTSLLKYAPQNLKRFWNTYVSRKDFWPLNVPNLRACPFIWTSLKKS